MIQLAYLVYCRWTWVCNFRFSLLSTFLYMPPGIPGMPGILWGCVFQTSAYVRIIRKLAKTNLPPWTSDSVSPHSWACLSHPGVRILFFSVPVPMSRIAGLQAMHKFIFTSQRQSVFWIGPPALHTYLFAIILDTCYSQTKFFYTLVDCTVVALFVV